MRKLIIYAVAGGLFIYSTAENLDRQSKKNDQKCHGKKVCKIPDQKCYRYKEIEIT